MGTVSASEHALRGKDPRRRRNLDETPVRDAEPDPKTSPWAVATMFASVTLLALIAGVFVVPRVLPERQQDRDREEARSSLSDLFTAEKALFGEYMTYGTDLVGVNWAPTADPRFVYGYCNEYPQTMVGFSIWKPDRNHTAHPEVIGTPPRYTPALSINDPCGVLAKLGLADKFVVTGQDFRAFAIGNLDDDPDLEIWSIDQVKNLTQLAVD